MILPFYEKKKDKTQLKERCQSSRIITSKLKSLKDMRKTDTENIVKNYSENALIQPAGRKSIKESINITKRNQNKQMNSRILSMSAEASSILTNQKKYSESRFGGV